MKLIDQNNSKMRLPKNCGFGVLSSKICKRRNKPLQSLHDMTTGKCHSYDLK